MSLFLFMCTYIFIDFVFGADKLNGLICLFDPLKRVQFERLCVWT